MTVCSACVPGKGFGCSVPSLAVIVFENVISVTSCGAIVNLREYVDYSLHSTVYEVKINAMYIHISNTFITSILHPKNIYIEVRT